MALTDGVSFTAASAGNGSFVFGSARNSFLNPAQAIALGTLVNGQTVSYLAQDSLTNPVQREWGHGTFLSSNGGVIVRNSVSGSISNGISGSSVISFSNAPIVSLTLLSVDAGTLIDTSVGSSQGMVLYRSSVAWSALSAGNSGQFLQTQGTGANPQWSTVTSSVVASSIIVNLTPISGGTTTSILYDNAGVVGERLNATALASGNLKWFVASSGSDTNSGSSNAPFATIGHGVYVAAQYDYQNTFQGTVNVADGTYTEHVVLPQLVNGNNILTGDNATPSNCIVTGAGGNAFSLAGGDCNWQITGFEIQGTFNTGISATQGAVCVPGLINFNGPQNAMHADFKAIFFGTGDGLTYKKISGVVMNGRSGSYFNWDFEPHIFSGSSSTLTGGWINLRDGSYVTQQGISFTNSSELQGTAYFMQGDCMIYTTNGLVTDLPGNITLSANFADDSCAIIANGSGFVSNGFAGRASIGSINTQTSTSYTLQITDGGGTVEMGSSLANQVIIPPTATVAFPRATTIKVVQTGVGATTIVASSTITGNNFGAVGGQWKSATVYSQGSSIWVQTT